MGYQTETILSEKRQDTSLGYFRTQGTKENEKVTDKGTSERLCTH